MAKGTKIGKVTRKPGTLVYVTKSGDVMETKPNRGGAKKKATPKKKSVAKKKTTTKRKTTAKKKTAAKRK